jgi:hypothetical protein
MSSDHYEAAKAAWETAGSLVQGDRRETHGDFKENFEAIAGLWDAYIAAKNYGTSQFRVSLIDAEDVAQMMVLMKIARTMNGRLNPDDYVDAIGYATIAAGLATSSG